MLVCKVDNWTFSGNGWVMSDIALTQDVIVEEALALLQEDGLDHVTFRKLAARLGVKGPSLYWHISDKSFLLGRMTRSIMNNCIAGVGEVRTWQEWLYSFALQLWHAQVTIRDCAPLLLQAKWEEEWLEELGQGITKKLGSLGLPAEKAIVMQSTVQSLVTGWAAFAHGPNATYVDSYLGSGVEAALLQGVRTLIRGWSAEISADATWGEGAN